MAKSQNKLVEEGFIYSELFGVNYKSTVSTLRKLLKPHGLKLVVRSNYREWGDSAWVKIERDDQSSD